ncbi:MAG: methylmalonyl Co-A mutase-associated GTPase MeaB [Acidobacteriota bacterium]|nr:methylmalonyl Co-A mutase-associated GTPase MeaB [Acidobacteriota bacterium]
MRAIARAITQVENADGRDLGQLLRELFPYTGRAFVIGVTGSPGTGKSTLVDQLARHYAESGLKVGIILVDPTSPFSGGAILGDRVRMQSLFTNPGIFIRSMATRGKLGGLSAAVDEALMILDAAGFEILIIETVGVGQDEVDIVKTAHATLVMLVPGMGDDIQAFKAGIMEISDIYVVNKADREGASAVEGELTELLSIATGRNDGWTPPIVQTIASQGEGVSELVAAIQEYRDLSGDPENAQGGIPLFRERLMELLKRRLTGTILGRIPDEKLDRYAEKMMTRELDPYTIVEHLLRDLGFEEESHG